MGHIIWAILNSQCDEGVKYANLNLFKVYLLVLKFVVNRPFIFRTTFNRLFA